MRIGVPVPYAADVLASVEEVVAYERCGVDVVFVPEAYTFDAVSQLGYLAARTSVVQLASSILPLYTRTPTLLAMTAAGLDHLSGGRFMLGLGASGPQVIEGFHGVHHDAPIGRTREIVAICRQVWRRERVQHQGRHYRVPLPAGEGSGLGLPLKLVNVPFRPRIPVMIAALGPRNVALAAEIAEAWEPILFHPGAAHEVWGGPLAEGRARRDPDLPELDVVVPTSLAIGGDLDAARRAHRATLALYTGGMGAAGRNYYNDLVARYGYVEEMARVQDLYLAGRRQEAADVLPDDLVDATSLIGDAATVAGRLEALRRAGVTTVSVTPLAAAAEDRVADIDRFSTLVHQMEPA